MASFYQTISRAQPTDAPISHAQHVMKTLYGYATLRPHQHDVLEPFLRGRDTLAVIPTGGGKSMCYVLPAMMSPGVGVVISPLISLIRDQVIKLRAVGVPAAAIDSMQSREQKDQVMKGLHHNLIKVLYISPERLALRGFRKILSAQKIRFLAVDEAHCVSEWGSDFRPEYRKLGGYFDELPHQIPRLAVTATATAKVRADIVRFVGLRDFMEVIRTPIRENLKIETRKLSSQKNHSKQIIKALHDSAGQGIIYTFSRKNTQRLTAILKHENIITAAYHAGLSAQHRDRTLSQFLASELKVVVATNAFGLGIDKKDIRFVHHYGLPPSLESYLQQIGRAGRDGLMSRCCLFFQNSDANIHRYLTEHNYPPLSRFHKIYHALNQSEGGMPLTQLAHAVYGSHVLDDSRTTELQRMLHILLRENFITIQAEKSSSTLTTQSDQWVTLTGTKQLIFEFLEVFINQKDEAKRKIKAMERYAHAKHNRNDVIKQYFDEPASNVPPPSSSVSLSLSETNPL